MAITVSTSKLHKDLDFHFDINPITNDVPIVADVKAIKQSVLNILLTNHGERPFKPTFGANLRSYLFEPVDNVTIVLIANQIKEAIINWEPRVRVVDIKVRSKADRNAIDISAELKIIGTGDMVTVETSLERIR